MGCEVAQQTEEKNQEGATAMSEGTYVSMLPK
jgi:hypothetical protein